MGHLIFSEVICAMNSMLMTRLNILLLFIGFCVPELAYTQDTDCNGVLNGSALSDTCGVCQQAYLYDFILHTVQFVDIAADAVAGPTQVVVMPDDPGNPYWNASCSSIPGCTDPTACNFSYLATEDDGTCGISDDCEECQQPFCYDPVTHDVTYGAQADCGQVWVGVENLSNPMMNPYWNAACTDCNGVLNGSALIDTCGVCHQAYLYDFILHTVVFVDVAEDAVAGPTQTVILPDNPGNPYWNASCSSIPGCTDPTACNFSYLATEDDGTCGISDDCEECQQPFCYDPVTHDVTYGAQADCGQVWVGVENLSNPMMNPYWNAACTDCNGVLNGSALIDTCGVCHQAYLYDFILHTVVFVDVAEDAVAGPTQTVILPDNPGNPYWNASCSSVPGCTDPTACNFSYLATEDDGTCGISDDCEECQQPFCYDPVTHDVTYGAQADCGQVWVGVENLSNPMMNPNWNASCEVLGCMYTTACNYAPNAERDDLSCEWSSCIVQGCTYPSAENFSTLAEQDNGTCDFESTCVGDVDSDGAVTASDLLALLASFGQYCN